VLECLVSALDMIEFKFLGEPMSFNDLILLRNESDLSLNAFVLFLGENVSLLI
jgi:hypothetical protein